MKALVTGTAGFIGSTLTRRLLAEGHEVVGVDCITDYYEASIKQDNLSAIVGNPRFTFIQANLLTLDLKILLSDIDVVFHQAGQPGVRKSWGTDFSDYIENNIAATQRLLEHALTAPRLQKFVYASSSSVYGNAESYPTSEDTVPHPRSPYGVTKLAAEHLCSLYADNFGLPTVSLRYFTVYGPRQRPDMAFTRFCQAALAGTPITIYGDGEQVRDFTYVDDIVEANILAALTPTQPGLVLNVAGGTSITVNETLKIIEHAAGKPLVVHHQAAVNGDVHRTGGEASRIRDSLGWKPATPIETGLLNQVEWARTLTS